MGDIAKNLTSPAKLAFAGYVLLVYSGHISHPSPWRFLAIVALFCVAQVFHDDWLRIVLNRCAERKCSAKSLCPGCGKALF
jgi:hypothetical protein